MITVVGGTYDEYCFEPFYKERFGSGLRACKVLTTINKEQRIEFYTFCNIITAKYLQNFTFTSYPTETPFSISFYYDYPLIEPRISPRPDTFNKGDYNMNVAGENILYYGLFEGSASIQGQKVVYDPQSPIMPKAFSTTNSKANQLAYVINLREAEILAQSNEIEKIKDFFLNKEDSYVLVLKMGPRGAIVALKDVPDTIIPVYKTNKVWPIGSGDVFAATFAYYWFNGENPIKSAEQASWHTACYCNYNDFVFCPIGADPLITELHVTKPPTDKVYLAGPFFTFSQRWLIDQIRTSLLGMKLNVFSPFHDVGHGLAEEVVQKDIEALEESKILFAVLDGLDSGTIFEIGYAVKKGIPVIAYVENETSESVKMLEGTNCIIEKDLTTAIYKCFWLIAKND